MGFLTVQELNTHIYSELVNAITQNDPDIVQAAIDATHGQVRNYLSRFDTEALFNAIPKDAMLLMYCKDIATWHFLVLSNAGVDITLRKERYDDALADLKDIRSGKMTPDGWPLKSEDQKPGYFNWGSNERRSNHY